MEKNHASELRLARKNLDLVHGELSIQAISTSLLKCLRKYSDPRFWDELNESALVLVQSLPAKKTSLIDSDKFDVQGNKKLISFTSLSALSCSSFMPMLSLNLFVEILCSLS